MSPFYQESSGTQFEQIFVFSQKKAFAKCITKTRIAIITATIQFIRLILV